MTLVCLAVVLEPGMDEIHQDLIRQEILALPGILGVADKTATLRLAQMDRV